MLYINGRFLSQKLTGVQRFAIEIISNFKNLFFDYTILAPKDALTHELSDKLNIKIIGAHTGTLWEQIDLPLYLRSIENPLLINFCNTAPILYKNQIVAIHDLAYIAEPKWFSKKFIMWYKVLIPSIAKRAKVVITVSDFSRHELVKRLGIYPAKIKVINNAVNNYAESYDTKAEYANTYGRYILFVGSIDPRKNIVTLLKAFQKLNASDLKLIIAGDVNKNFTSLNIQENPAILKVGRVSDDMLHGLYANALAFIYPSLYEGFGIPPLEAMSFGCPVVCSNAASLPEVCGDAVLYFNPHNPDELSTQLNKLLKNEECREQLIAKGFERLNLYSWQQSALKVIDIVNSIADKEQ